MKSFTMIPVYIILLILKHILWCKMHKVVTEIGQTDKKKSGSEAPGTR